MKHKRIVIGVIVGALILLCLLAVAGGPILQRMGIEPFCIQGDWPDIQFVRCPEQAAAAAPLPFPTASPGTPTPLIFDDDGSPDGMIALLYFLGHPQYDVRAVTVSCGEAHPDIFAGHLSRLLARLDRPDIPIGAGRDTPLAGDNTFPEPWREASDAFWDITLPEYEDAAVPVPAAQLIADTLNQSEAPVTVFISGNHTNVAEALRLDPAAAGKIGDIFIMGGSLHEPGNIHSDWPEIDNRVAEWNIWVDPLAAKEIFDSGRPLHLAPLDATNQLSWTRADAEAWSASSSEEGLLADEILGWMLDNWSPDGVFIWDLVAAIQATDPAMCPEEANAVDVITAPGPDEGRTILTEQTPNTAVCLDPDSEQMRARAASILGR